MQRCSVSYSDSKTPSKVCNLCRPVDQARPIARESALGNRCLTIKRIRVFEATLPIKDTKDGSHYSVRE